MDKFRRDMQHTIVMGLCRHLKINAKDLLADIAKESKDHKFQNEMKKQMQLEIGEREEMNEEKVEELINRVTEEVKKIIREN